MVVSPSEFDLEKAVAAFERAWPADLVEFLPVKDSPEYLSVLAELVRIDLELAWDDGQRRDAEYYFERFPELASDSTVARCIEYEAARQSRCTGGNGNAVAQSNSNGDHTTTILHGTDPASDLGCAVDANKKRASGIEKIDNNLKIDPEDFPAVGAFFLGFQLIAELGRGAFSRVYLAREPAVANRLVAVKVTGDARTEVGALARLRHTNIAPVLSVQRQGQYEAVVMPYLGSTTLATVIRQMKAGSRPEKSVVERLKKFAPQLRIEGFQLGRDWPEVVLALAVKVASGLAHSHERGILHRDIKPANILIADDGEPLLLDFNLAQRRTSTSRVVSSVGGTVPYMAPEQLQTLNGDWDAIDARADVYSFGLVIYELLTGIPAFEIPSAPMPEAAHRLLEARRKPAPNVRNLAPAVTPAFAAIIAKCLEVNPSRRFADAKELHNDLARQQKHLPLQFADEPSYVERCKKWCRRHPRLSSSATVGALAISVLCAVGLIGWSIKQDRDRLALVENERLFRQEFQAAQIALAHPVPDADARTRGVTLAQSAWNRSESLRHPTQMERGTLALLLAKATRQEGHIADAWEWNRKSQDLLKPYSVAAIVQAEGFRGIGALAELKSDLIGVNNSSDHLAGLELLARGKTPQALSLLANATDGDPNSVTAWYVRGVAEEQAGKHADAVSSFSTVIALDAQLPEAWHARGVARLALKKLDSARRDLDESIKLLATPTSYFDRGLIREAQGDLAGALADFDASLASCAESSRFRSARSRVRFKLGDKHGGETDVEYIVSHEPTTEIDWLARIAVQASRNPAKALDDAAACLERFPESWQAWLAKASLLSEDLHSVAEAIVAMNKAIELHPGDATLLASRGVLHARAKNYSAARQDGDAALQFDSSPAVTYQVAGIFALSAADRPNDRDRAISLLAKSIHRDYGLQWFDSDPDLASIRNLPEVQRLIEQAKLEAQKLTSPRAPAK